MFSKEKVNTGRQIELDLARGLAGLFMIFIHAQEIFANRAVIDSPFGVFNDFVSTVPAAPVFMFLMGLGIVYSRKSEPKNYYKRGAMLLLGGYLLNTLRGLLPNLYQAWARPQAADDYVAQAVSTFFYIDILAFAGLALMTFGAIKQFRLGAGAVAVLAIGLGLLNLVLPNDIENPVLSVFFGLFWGADAISFFPI